MNSTNLISVFLTGLFVGGLSCMAVQGGLLAATLAQREEERLKEKAKDGNTLPILSFLVAKLVSYTILGFVLGLLGSVLTLSLPLQITMQLIVVIFMIGTALNILNVHPIFRFFVIQPPTFLTRIVRKQTKSKDMFAPAILGAFTIFIPCGTTQAMMALAIVSGNPFYGAAILFSFILGTSPLFFILGYFATKLGDVLHQKFMKFAAFAIIMLALFNFNNAIALTGSPLTFEKILKPVWCTMSFCNTPSSSDKITDKPVNDQTINIAANGYNPNKLIVKAGTYVTLHLKNTDGQGCVQTFTIPSLGVQKSVPLGKTDTINFTAPSKSGEIAFMCSMGMYRGVISVI